VTSEAAVRALLSFRNPRGHWPGCDHRFHVTGSERHKPGVDCPDAGCGGSGWGCSEKCRGARAAIAEDGA